MCNNHQYPTPLDYSIVKNGDVTLERVKAVDIVKYLKQEVVSQDKNMTWLNSTVILKDGSTVTVRELLRT